MVISKRSIREKKLLSKKNFGDKKDLGYDKGKDKKAKKKDEKKEKKKNKGEEKTAKAKGIKELRPESRGKRRLRKSGNRNSFAYYIHKVLKTVHPGNSPDDSNKVKCTLSVKGMAVCDSLVTEIYDKLSKEAISLTMKGRKRTLGSMEVQTAVRLCLPGELAKHAIGDGTKAVTNFQQQRTDNSNSKRLKNTV